LQVIKASYKDWFMAQIHKLILKEGLDSARRLAETANDRRAIEAAASVMAEEQRRIGITHAGFAMTGLPHRRIEESQWRRESPMTTLLVEAGSDRQGRSIGVPYGPIARLILLYLQSESIRTGSPEVALGRSMNAWLTRMQISPGGRTRQLVAEQARRISSCRLTFFTDKAGGEVRSNGAFVRDTISMAGVVDEAQSMLWQDRVRLDEGFYRSLREHPVPVREEAIRAIGQRSMALDVYVWLAYRLHVLEGPVRVSWPALHAQFGAGFAHMKHLKPRFLEALQLATAVYEESRVEVFPEGLTLYPSAPAVPKLKCIGSGL
jgi:hypothetical protein